MALVRCTAGLSHDRGGSGLYAYVAVVAVDQWSLLRQSTGEESQERSACRSFINQTPLLAVAKSLLLRSSSASVGLHLRLPNFGKQFHGYVSLENTISSHFDPIPIYGLWNSWLQQSSLSWLGRQAAGQSLLLANIWACKVGKTHLESGFDGPAHVGYGYAPPSMTIC